MKKKVLNCLRIVSFLLIVVFPISISATTYYVSTTGNDANPGTVGSPFLTLTHALTVVVAGDNISIAAGTYSDDDITFPAVDNITITGAGIGSTIFDGDGDGSSAQRFVTISGSVTGLTISDMTIQDMDVNGNGAGFNITTSGSVTLQDIKFYVCQTITGSDVDGGGVYVSSSSTAIIDRCIFQGNKIPNTSNSDGSAIANVGGIATIQNCLFYDNNCQTTTSNGHIYTTGTTNIYNCTFTENLANVPEVYITGGTTTIKNTIFYNNAYATYNAYRNSGTATISYSLYDHSTYNITPTNSINNSDVDPIFMDASTDDFRISAISPCRDKGTESSTPTNDINGATRGSGGTNTGTTYDIGCYENACASGTYYVNDNSTVGDTWCSAVGNDSNGGTTGAPYLTLNQALKDCGCSGNTIRVDKGTYSDDDLVLSTDATASTLTIEGAGIDVTIFDGDGDASSTQRFMTINIDADNISITDMTIQDMDVNGNGAGFNITTTGSITIQDVKFSVCQTITGSDVDGGAVYVSSTSTSIIDRCIFKGNINPNTSNSDGSAIANVGGTATIQNCLFYDNNCQTTTSNGHIYSTGTTNIYNCTFTENLGNVPEIYITGGTTTIKNTIFYNNAYATYNAYRNSGTATISYSLYDHSTYNITPTNSINNSDVDPIFMDASTDDFSISAISPCRDKGTETSTPAVDIDGNDRGTNGVYSGTTYDIGCYENSCTAGIYYVNDASTIGDTWCSAVGNDSNTGTISDPYLTLNQALKDCGCSGNTIRVDKGTFSDDDLVLSTDATASTLTIEGAGIDVTIFDGDGDASSAERFMTINIDADNIVISDMTIQDMDVNGNGAGFNVTTTGSITFQDVEFYVCQTITGNDRDGGGVYVSSSSTAIIDRCIFQGNKIPNTVDSDGSAIANVGGTATIQNCLFYDNNCQTTTSNGHIYTTGTTNIYNCTFTENLANVPEVYITGGTTTIKNSIFYNNAYATYNVYENSGIGSLDYCLYDNTTYNITPTNSINNSDVDPLFMDATTDDFRISAISPAKDVGTSGGSIPTVDIDGNKRGNNTNHTGSGYDIGCYENVCNPGTYYVNDNSLVGDIWVIAVGNDGNTGGSSDPFLTLYEALKVCGCSGNSVKVDAGSYADDDISISASDFSIQGAGKDLVTFDGDSDGSSNERFMTINVDANNFKISDLTIQDMDVNGNGAGFNITTSGSITLQDIKFYVCQTITGSDVDGGGVYVSSSSTAIIDRCIFQGNKIPNTSNSDGSAIANVGGIATIQNCLFYDNNCQTTTSNGHIYTTGTTNIYNCTFTENLANVPEVYITGGTTTINNTIFYNNAYATYNAYRNSGTATISYSLYDHSMYNITPTNSDNSSNPNFTNAASDDFTINASSTACINTGTSGGGIPAYDLVQALRPYGGGYDMGCYEYSPVYYWVGGTGNWSDYTNHWSNSTGGAAGSFGNAPTSSDNVIFDANSSGTVTIDATANCYNFTSTGSTATIAGANDVNVYGSITLGSGFTWSNTGTLTLAATSTGKEIQTNSITIDSDVNFNGTGGEWTLLDGLSLNGNLTLSAGTLLATSNDITLPGNWTSSGGVFIPGTGTVTFTGNSTTIAGTDASENFYNLTLNKTAGQSLSCGGSIATLAIGNNYTQTSGNFSAPATFTVGTDFTMTSGTYTANSALTVGGDMLLTSGTYTAAANPATISGDFTNNGATFNAGTSTFTFNGSDFNVNGSTSSTFYNITLSGAYTMSTSTIVENTLDLGAKLILDDCTLTVGTTSSNGSITNYSSSNYIVASDIGGFIGYLKRYVNSNTSYVCPIGDVDDYTPLTFTLNSNGGLASSYITTYNDIHAITGTSTNFGSYDRRFWSLTQSGITTPNYDVDLVYADGDVFGTEANYLPIKYSGGTWYQPTGASYGSFTEEGTSASVTVGTNTLNWTGLSTFSLFGGAGDYVSPLPIQLLYFNAELMGQDVLLSWETASERNNDYFTVEKTLDGEYYEIIGMTDGAGNSISPQSYSMYDFNIAKVINYYRLKQTDYDGNSTFSKLVSVDNRSDKNEKEIIGIYNLLGQEIDEYYKGLVIIVYSDGSSIKMIQE